MDVDVAKTALDVIMRNADIHFYYPIQIAEILYRHRIGEVKDLRNLESYKDESKKWRDDISMKLLGSTCRLSNRIQNKLFSKEFISPEVLNVLGVENKKKKGIVEAYIYDNFFKIHGRLREVHDCCCNATAVSFDMQRIVGSFMREKGLMRSLDNLYEVIVCSLFFVIADVLKQIDTFENNQIREVFWNECREFAVKVTLLDLSHPIYHQSAKVFRVGLTNAADRGLDMYSNWGPAIQVKHLTLDEELANTIVDEIQSDRIIIVCKDVERDVLVSVLRQIGWASRVQSVITEEDLRKWYDKALRGQYASQMGENLLNTFAEQMQLEFPSVGESTSIIDNRHYEQIDDSYWCC